MFKNFNFLIYFKALPENDDYKPSLHIRCARVLSIRTTKEVIGTYTSNSIKPYYKTVDCLEKSYNNIEYCKHNSVIL